MSGKSRVWVHSPTQKRSWSLSDDGEGGTGFLSFVRDQLIRPRPQIKSVCERAGMSRPNYYLIATRGQIPSIDTLISLLVALGMSPAVPESPHAAIAVRYNDDLFEFTYESGPDANPARAEARERLLEGMGIAGAAGLASLGAAGLRLGPLAPAVAAAAVAATNVARSRRRSDVAPKLTAEGRDGIEKAVSELTTEELDLILTVLEEIKHARRTS